MKSVIIIIYSIVIFWACHGTPKKCELYEKFEFIGAINCDSTNKFALIRLINTNETSLKVLSTDTITFDNEFYKNIYIVDYKYYNTDSKGDWWIRNTINNLYLIGCNINYGIAINCPKLSHLTYLKNTNHPVPVK